MAESSSTDRNAGPILEARGLHRSFGGVRAVQGVSIAIHPGRVSALVGDNGAGKSTTLKMLAGVIQPDDGTILFEDREIRMKSPRVAKRIGIETVYQDLALADTLDVVQNVFSGREMHRAGFIRRRRMQEGSYALLSELEVRIPTMFMAVRGLSGGQRQGTAIARAVGWGSRVLLLDEPTAALGVAERGHVLALIETLKTRGLGILLISHSLPDVFEVADTITILRRGKVVRTVSVDDVRENEVVSLITGVSPGDDGMTNNGD